MKKPSYIESNQHYYKTISLLLYSIKSDYQNRGVVLKFWTETVGSMTYKEDRNIVSICIG